MFCFTSVIILLSQNHNSSNMERTSELLCFTNEIPDANRLKKLHLILSQLLGAQDPLYSNLLNNIHK